MLGFVLCTACGPRCLCTNYGKPSKRLFRHYARSAPHQISAEVLSAKKLGIVQSAEYPVISTEYMLTLFTIREDFLCSNMASFSIEQNPRPAKTSFGDQQTISLLPAIKETAATHLFHMRWSIIICRKLCFSANICMHCNKSLSSIVFT